MRFFYDTEFIETGKSIDLISIGIVSEDGREYYAVCSDAPWDRIKRHPWLMQNVVPSLPGPRPITPLGVPRDEPEKAKPGKEWFWELDTTATCVKPRFVIANEVRDFLLSDDEPELWAYYAAFDHVALAWLWGPMSQMPTGLPYFTHDLQQRWEDVGRPTKPPQSADEHNALADARWNVELWLACQAVSA